MAQKKVRVVFSGGGSSGTLAHIGALQELEARGYVIEAVAGVSAGSLVAGAYASGLEPAQIAQAALKLLAGAKPLEETAVDVWPHPRVYKGGNLLVALKKILKPTFKDARVPLSIVTTDLHKRDRALWSDTSTPDANLPLVVRASMSVPGAFAPVMINKHLHVDGGVVSNLPMDIWGTGHPNVIGLQVTHRDASKGNPTTPWDYISAIVASIVNHNEIEDIEDVPYDVIPVFTHGASLSLHYSKQDAEALILGGKNSMAQWLDEVYLTRGRSGHGYFHGFSFEKP